MLLHNSRSAAIVLATVVLAWLGGCAFSNETIELKYQPPAAAVQIPGANAVSVEVRVNDQRPDKTKVSSKKNGFGMETAAIVASEDPSITVRKAIEQALSARGFRLLPGAASIQVACDLARFYNDHKLGFFAGDAIAELQMIVIVRSRDGRPLFTRSLAAQGIEPNTQLMTGNNAMLALNRALANGVTELFGDPAFIASLTGSPMPRSAMP